MSNRLRRQGRILFTPAVQCCLHQGKRTVATHQSPHSIQKMNLFVKNVKFNLTLLGQYTTFQRGFTWAIVAATWINSNA